MAQEYSFNPKLVICTKNLMSKKSIERLTRHLSAPTMKSLECQPEQ